MAKRSLSIATDPEPVNGRKVRKLTSSLGIPKIVKTGERARANRSDSPLILNSSTAQKIATNSGKVFMHRSTASLAPETKHEYALMFLIRHTTHKMSMPAGTI